MSLLDPINIFFARLLIPVPIIILIVGICLFFFAPNHRKVVGVVLGVLGSLGLFLFSGIIWASLAPRFESGVFGMARGLLFVLAAIEIVIIVVGIVCLVKSNPVKVTKPN
jgi:hypothetical protein